MSYQTCLATASDRAVRVVRGLAPLALIGLITLGACDNETTPVGPRAVPAAGALAKGGNGGGGGGGGGVPGPTGRLYFTSDIQSPGNLDVYAVNPDGTGLVRLTTSAGADQVARAARTTGRVAFMSDRLGQSAIFTMNADGTNQQAIYTPSTGTIENIAVSADGTRIAFTATIAGQTDLFTIGADGTGLTQLTNNAVVERDPAWAPNARNIAFAATVDGADDIFSISVSRRTVSKLTTGGIGNANPSYSPDGRNVVFATTRDGNYELYTMRTSGANQTRILQTAGWHEVYPVYSPDGSYVAYLSYLASGGGPGLRYIGLGTTGQTGPVSGGYAIWSVSWGM
jgi:Tol biopolymer transport system component